jgi:hypothetical protein
MTAVRAETATLTRTLTAAPSGILAELTRRLAMAAGLRPEVL